MADKLKISAVTCVKNEGPFLLEWIAFHRLIGVTDFLFYSNDCDDGTEQLLDALQELGIVRHKPNPAEGRNYQMEALKDAARDQQTRASDWIWIADVDEFPSITVGARNFPSLIEACGNPSAISLTFRFFANSGVDHFRDEPVTAQFCMTHAEDIWADQTSQEVKTLVRADFPLKYFGAHRPFGREGHILGLRWTDGSGNQVPDSFSYARTRNRIRKFPAKGVRQFASLNHYALRSKESYIVKCERGDVNREDREFSESYWQDRNDSQVKDLEIRERDVVLRDEINFLKGLGNIAELHSYCTRKHAEKVSNLLSLEEYRGLYDNLGKLPSISIPELNFLKTIGLHR
ncbi:Glycosyl transferase family 2 [Poseidonocella pacifica]|uniref:Glycosyl transferase family 2 n=1 Tax=Poseidonocella pacifica TaxID=871651 RepID=A0A1I0V6F6_9RHOB|nr:glycosyltransferase family 2 protein [Poseidonocella pacifica]SFA71822.1 Glycosyl transferase family 2 [Poseidonocella pacifica]